MMEAAGSYDVLSEPYSRFADSDSDEGQPDVEAPAGGGRKWRNLFKRRNFLEKCTREVAAEPINLWDISSDQFERAINLRPQSKFAGEAALDLEPLEPLERPPSPSAGSQSSDSTSTSQEEQATSVYNGEERTFKRVSVAALKHLKSMMQMKSSDIDIKIILLGDKSVGKSSIIRRFIHGSFTHDTTVRSKSYETKLMKFQNNQQFCLHIFEIAGDVSNAIVSSTCVCDAIGAMIIFDVNDDQSFRSIPRWKSELDSKGKQTKNGHIPCLLLANKCDSSDVTFNMCELDNYCAQQGIPSWFDTSARNDFNVKNAFVYLMRRVLAEQRGIKSTVTQIKSTVSAVSCVRIRRKQNQFDDESTTML